MMMKKLLLAQVMMAAIYACAQPTSLYFERITAKDGLSNDHVNCILQDRRGFIWLGTNDGLNRFDGHNFLIFRNRPGDTTSISGNTITDILEDADGILWIATADGGLARYDHKAPPSLQFKQYKHQPGDNRSIPVNIINAMIDDEKGFLWLATSGAAVIRFNKRTAAFDHPVPAGPRAALDLCYDKNGLIWAGRQGGGILKIDPVGIKVDYDKRYDNLYANLPHVVVSSLYCDREKNMWYGSWDKVLYKFDPRSGTESIYREDEQPLSFINDEIVCFDEDAGGHLWMGGKTAGLQIMDKRTGSFINYRHNPSQEGSVSDNTIHCIKRDREGRMWIGTDKGVSICNPVRQQFTQVFLLPNSRQSPKLTIYDFLRDENRNLWIGTSEGLFFRKNNSGTIVHKPVYYQGHKLAVTKFFTDKAGQLYLGTNYSLFKYSLNTGVLEILPNTEKDKVMNKIIESRVVSIVEDVIENHPVLLVSPYGHYLAYYDLIDQRWISRLDSSQNIIKRFNIRDNLVHKLYKSGNGKIWMAAANEGLGEWITNRPGGSIFYGNDPAKNDGLSNNHIFDITGDHKGNLWISTYGGGLNYMEVKGRTIHHMAATNNLLEGIATDSKGNVWMISNGNLQKFDILSKSSRTYTLPDLERSGGVKGYIYKDEAGKMYVAGNNYFIEFHADSLVDRTSEPRVYLTDFKVFDSSYSHLLNGRPIRLSHRQNYFTIEFAAPDYAFPQPVQYAYMLEGFDKTWVETGSRNNIVFSNLPGGTYTFRVRATNSPGVWTEMRQPLRIIITPPFWKRWWFYVLCVAFVSAATYLLYRYRINELLKRQAIRNKIAQDLHDNVGSTLSSISVYSQVAQIQNEASGRKDLNEILDKIGTTSTDMISEMNDIVWAINPRNDSMEKMVQRMESFAKPLLAAKNIRFRFNYDSAILSTWLQMEKRKNFYLIFKEAINNIVKYSAATEVSVDISIRNRKLELVVTDNGKGFDPAAAMTANRQSLSGNGLRNMKMRAAEMKGDIDIISKPGAGAVIKLVSHIP
jgi:signal transduction histidine kinase/ligand-binding sensor domain-containing protein